MEIGRPLAATLLLGVVLILAAFGTAAWWADLSAAEAERDAKADFVSRGVREMRRSGGTDVATPPRLFVEADSETLAAAQLDTLVRATTAAAGGTVLSSRADAKHEDRALTGRIEVVAEIEGGNDVVQSILWRLETGTPMLLVDRLALRPAGTGTEAADTETLLHAEMTLSAYWDRSRK